MGQPLTLQAPLLRPTLWQDLPLHRSVNCLGDREPWQPQLVRHAELQIGQADRMATAAHDDPCRDVRQEERG